MATRFYRVIRERTPAAKWLAALAVLVAVAAVALRGRQPLPTGPIAVKTEPGDGPIRDALARGESVTIIGPTGLPAWHRFAFLPAQLGESPCGDGTCSFQTMDFTLLELLADPGIPRYVFEAEVRHLRGRGPLGPNDPQGLESIGVYFGANALPPVGGQSGTTLFAIALNDYPPRFDSRVGQSPQLLRFNPGLLLQNQDRTPGAFWTEGSAIRFTAAPERPGPWRQIRVDISPERVAVSWRPDVAGAEVPVAEWDGDQTRRRYGELQHWLDRAAPGTGLTVRPWHPRMPLGIWCNESAVAIRNVRISPR